MSPSDALDERKLRRLRLRDLRVLVAVAQSGSMGKAAATLAISQPAVSKTIAGMEQVLGVPLLERNAQGVEPTAYGHALLRSAAAVFDDLRQGFRAIEHLADPTSGDVRIGSTEAMTAGLIPAVIDRLCREHSRLNFHVVQAPTIATQYRDLRERKVDFVLGRLPASIGEDDLEAEVLFHDPLFIVAGEDNELVRRRRIKPAELVDRSWCLPPYEPYGSPGARLADAFRKVGLSAPRHTVISTSVQLFVALISTGRFLSVLSGSALHFAGQRLAVKALSADLPIEAGPVGLVRLKGRMLSPAAALFIEEARRIVRPLTVGR